MIWRGYFTVLVVLKLFVNVSCLAIPPLKIDRAQPFSEQTARLVFPGGGIYFYWQAGVVCYLRENGYDLSNCSFSGASAGALTSTLACTNVDFYEATDLALQLAANAGVWDRSQGLQGIWGELIEEWLHTLIPNPSMEHVKDRLLLLVTPVPTFGRKQVVDFSSKHDLRQCNMASIHLPWFLDGKLVSDFRGERYIDGSFRSQYIDYIPGKDSTATSQPSEQRILYVDWKQDPSMASNGGLKFVEALSPSGIYDLIEQGKKFAKVMEERGDFEIIPRILV